jgi:hypothetical protein
VLGGAARDHGLHAAGPELATVLVVVVAAVGDQAVGAHPGPAELAAHRADAVDERQQLGDVVAMPAGEADGQRDAGTVDQQMMLGAGAAAVNRRGPGQSPLEERGYGCRRPPMPTSRSRQPR